MVQTGDLLWEVPEYDQRCFVLHNNMAYIGNGDGTVMCIMAKTGAVKYVVLWADAFC
jgi:outer membrane protein assembly factor BamB